MKYFWFEISQALGISVWQTLWQGFIVGAVLYLILKIIPNSKPDVRYFSAYCALVIIFFLFIANLIHYVPENLELKNRTAGETIEIQTHNEKTTTFQTTSFWENGISNTIDFVYNHSRWISFIWFSGVMISYIRLIVSLSYLKRLRKSPFAEPPDSWKKRMVRLSEIAGVAIAPALMISDKIHSPITYGWIKPVVLIPASIATGLSADQVELIILHELAHIKRNDFIANLIKSVIRNFLFFHPVIWWAAAIIEEEREKACDDFALSLKNEPVTYIKTLAFAAGSGSIKPYAMPVSGQKKLLFNRINRIIQLSNNSLMKSQPQPLYQSHFFAALLSFFSLLLILGFSFGIHSRSFGNHLETQYDFTKESSNKLIIEFYNDNNQSTLNWRDKNSMAFTSSGKMPAIIFNGKVLPPFKSGEIPKELRDLDFNETEGVVHELSGEEKEAHDRKWGNGLVEVTLKPVDKLETDEKNPDGQNNQSFLTDSDPAEIKVRKIGATEIEEPQPLILVDGEVVEKLNVEPMDILTIEVIREGDLLKKYGGRGKHGVIRVITKTGKKPEEAAGAALFPNPSDNQTAIEVMATQSTHISVNIYNLNGGLIKTIAEDFYSKGKHTFRWDTGSWDKGIYIVEVKNGERISRHKLVIE